MGARNDAYGTGLADDFGAAWEDKGGTIGEEVIYDPEQPSYDSEADQITSGNPDAFVIIDFPEPFNKVGAALVRTGNWDPKKAFVTDGLVSAGAEEAGKEAVEGFRGTAPGPPRRANRRRRSSTRSTGVPARRTSSGGRSMPSTSTP